MDKRYNIRMTSSSLSLTIVIPALNEASTLPLLLQDLSAQKDIQIETIVVDGGSEDSTQSICEEFSGKTSISLQFISTRPGRAIQMNAGAKLASTDEYLFLHADTRITNERLLCDAYRFMKSLRNQSHDLRTAGHFPLRFLLKKASYKYYFYECKTHLNRPDCINGDQGFWITKAFFQQLGGFDESLPYMEDARLARKIFSTGRWITLPGELETSARRFEKEGFTQRQILNSFLCNFNAMGVNQFFQSALDVYRTQNKTSTLQMRPFLKLAHQQMNGDGARVAIHRWYQTGGYIAHNAWQLAFAFDCLRRRKQGLPPGCDNSTQLQFFDNYLSRATEWPLIKALTAVVTIAWFYSLFITQ